jgi:hypothetical protein
LEDKTRDGRTNANLVFMHLFCALYAKEASSRKMFDFRKANKSSITVNNLLD